jgi:ATP-dependent DNA helicase 2 subunit 2
MFLVDLSPSMGASRQVELPGTQKGETRTVEMTKLEWTLQFVKMKIQEMVCPSIFFELLRALMSPRAARYSTAERQINVVSSHLVQKVSIFSRLIMRTYCQLSFVSEKNDTDFRTETNNIINQKDGGYEHVSEYIPIGQPNASTLAKIDELRASETTGDRKPALVMPSFPTHSFISLEN